MIRQAVGATVHSVPLQPIHAKNDPESNYSQDVVVPPDEVDDPPPDVVVIDVLRALRGRVRVRRAKLPAAISR